MRTRQLIFLAVLFLSFSATAFTQGDPVDVGAAGFTALAMAVNTAGVFYLVNLITAFTPTLRRRAPQWIPILAMASGPVLNVAGAALSEALGHPIDFSPIIGAFGGSAAVVVHQFRTQRRRFRTRP